VVIDSNPTALRKERAEVAKTRAEAMKLRAETRKILRDAYWAPVAALSAVVVAAVGGITAVVVVAIKVLMAH
jgi:aspartate-semialdehyde dehydrogenase